MLSKVWEGISKKYLDPKQKLIMHTDAAGHIKEIEGVPHTAIIHQMKKIKDVWAKPFFSRREDIQLPDGGVLAVKAGTQFIDGVWSCIRRDIKLCMRRSDPTLVDKLVRVGQWHYWCQAKDPYESLKDTLDWNQ